MDIAVYAVNGQEVKVMFKIIKNRFKNSLKRKRYGCGQMILCSMLMCFTLCGTASAKPSEGSKYQEAEDLVQAFFDARSQCDIQKMNSFFEEENRELEIMTRVGKECGIEEYAVQHMDTYPLGENQEAWLVIVSFELKVEGFEVCPYN